jgi:hypothetical protein
MTKYDAAKAHDTYSFISKDWKPQVQSNSDDDKGDEPIVEEPTTRFCGVPNVFGASQATGPNHIPLIRLPPCPPGATQPTLTQLRWTAVEEECSAEEEEVNKSRVFCPERLQASVIKMMSSHSNAHPSILLSQTTNLPLRWLKYRGFFRVAGLDWFKHVTGRRRSYTSVRIVEFAK